MNLLRRSRRSPNHPVNLPPLPVAATPPPAAAGEAERLRAENARLRDQLQQAIDYIRANTVEIAQLQRVLGELLGTRP